MTTTIKTTQKLAIDGGPKVRTAPLPPRHLFGQEEKQAVMALFDEAIETGNAFGYGGAKEEKFCEKFAENLNGGNGGGGGFADGVNSGTNAVYVALRSLELEPFTEVIVPPISDPGGYMPVALLNCIPVVADSAADSYMPGAKQIEAQITERTSAILVAHIAGSPANMPEIMQVANKHNIPVVEDCAQAHGAVCAGQRVGTFGEVASFSTMFGKHIATGGQGGVVFTKSEERYWKIRRSADRGKPLNAPDANGNLFAAINCNMDELHATIGIVQIDKLDSIVRRRREFALRVQELCKQKLSAVRAVGDPDFGQSSFWFMFFKLDLDKLSVSKADFAKAVSAEGMLLRENYMHSAPFWEWFNQHKIFGQSGLPWSSEKYKGEKNPEYAMPNILATDAGQVNFMLHENMGEREANDLVAAMEKVEAVYGE